MEPQVTNQSANPEPKKSLPVLRIIIIVFAAVLAIEALIGAKTLLTPIPSLKKPQAQTITAASLTLSAPKSVKVGENVPVSVKVSTGGHLTTGVDLVLKYDSSKLEASDSAFTPGTIYDDYPPININSINGVIRISGVVGVNKPGFNGSGNFGILQFSAKSSGSTTVSLDFKAGQTNDSNILEVGTNNDVLGQVGSATINIQ